ncbi:MAG: hypothetical protein AAF567_24760 [Actinomycetota bacterium]
MVEEADQSDETVARHRRFAVGLNNAAWAVLDDQLLGPDSSLEDRESFLYSTIASTYHWIQIGNAANRARGEYLISRAASLIGRADLAVAHGDRCIELCESNPGVVEDWDLAFAYEAKARALAAAGAADDAATARAQAERLAAAIADDDDRAIVEGELQREPWFGLI